MLFNVNQPRFLYHVKEPTVHHGLQEFCLFSCRAQDVNQANGKFEQELGFSPFEYKDNIRVEIRLVKKVTAGQVKRNPPPPNQHVLHVPEPLIKAVHWFKSQGLNICFYCGVDLLRNSGKMQKNSRTWDHVNPKINGGGLKVHCCYNCNNKKGSLQMGEQVRKILTGFPTGEFYGERLYRNHLLQFVEELPTP